MPKSKRQRRPAAEVQRILRDLAASGLTRRQFATRRDIPLSTLHAWLAKGGRRATPQTRPDLISVGIIAGPTAALEIELPGGEIVRVGPGCRGEDLRAVLAELRRC